MSQYLLATAGLMLLLLGCESSNRNQLPPSFDVEFSSKYGPSRTTGTAEGILNGRLVFVAISSTSKGDAIGFVSSGSVVTKGGGGFKFAKLRRPDGTTEQLPSTNFIYQLIDGEWSETPETITLEEWNRFQYSSPDEYSIDELSRFLGRDLTSA
ncbi:hypothetical protein ACFL2H_08070 [Planctomycetota bacterium]